MKGYKRERCHRASAGVLKGAELGCLPIWTSYERCPAVMPWQNLAARYLRTSELDGTLRLCPNTSMSSGDMFTFQPTFTQGLILGQCSILALLAVVLKYLFLDTEHSQKVPVYADPAPPVLQPSILSAHAGENSAKVESESTHWLNTLLHQVRASPRFCARSSVC